MRRGFISGPMRGIKHFNHEAFLDAEPLFMRALEEDQRVGLCAIFNPARYDQSNGFDPVALGLCGNEEELSLHDFDLTAAMKKNFQELTHCTDILLLPGWAGSCGATAELHVAEALGLKVWHWRNGEVVPDEEDEEEEPTGAIFDFTRLVDEAYVGDPDEHTRASDSGGKKGRKLAEIGWVDPLALDELAKVAGYGAGKYEDGYNYLKGFPYSWSYNALQRHANAHWGGEDKDPETDLYHAAQVAWHALCQVSFLVRGIGTDDRPKR